MMFPEDLEREAAAIARNLADVRTRADAAALRAGRNPAEVTILGVTKTKPASTVRAAAMAGIITIGENYVQELVAKHDELGDIVRWHMIGHLQRNKVRLVAPFVAMIHSVDSLRLAREIGLEASSLGRSIPVLLQVNTSGEESKFGVEPGAVLELARSIAALPGVELEGMMTIAAFLNDVELLRPMFRLLRELRDDAARALGHPLPHLSMGMTHDFETAIEEGATLVRVGTALFGLRN
ncbi:MAG TPA: YggS family pyridoxal phosphate-dependent enzyme [Candidatus Kapabacteria bacterium]|nr:YggS family pyridoxal phosphate-dependent enzyme [Candidatus Kapabacteria bacterium]